MRILPLAAALLAIAVSACSQQAPGAPSSVSRMQKAEVEAIVKDYLLEHPEVLREAMDALDRHDNKAMVAKLVSNPDDPILGPKDAPVTIVEFFDYNCGYCRSANDWVFQEIDNKKQDVKVIFKEFPILHESSLAASKSALAAEKQGKYREMHIALMKTKDFTPEGLEKIAKSVGLDIEKWKKDMADPKTEKHIAGVYGDAELAKVEGTPGFFINGEFLNGFDEAKLEALIEKARAQKKG